MAIRWDEYAGHMNDTVAATFGTKTITYQSGTISVEIPQAIPLDPIRTEDLSPGVFTIRWIMQSQLTNLGIVAKRGDRVIESGVTYVVDQVQVDASGAMRLILKKAG